jgi:hypothetical protein
VADREACRLQHGCMEGVLMRVAVFEGDCGCRVRRSMVECQRGFPEDMGGRSGTSCSKRLHGNPAAEIMLHTDPITRSAGAAAIR